MLSLVRVYEATGVFQKHLTTMVTDLYSEFPYVTNPSKTPKEFENAGH